MTKQSAGIPQQISEQIMQELHPQDPAVQVKVRRASLGWLHLQVITTIFTECDLDERERQIDATLAPLQLSLSDYPFLDYKLQTPQEAREAKQDDTPSIDVPLWSEILLAPEPDHPVSLEKSSAKRPFVVTFYSFKGGVGRSTALAFVGNILATRGQKVVMMDFDIEAPGLSFLAPSGVPREAPSLGVLDYLHQRYLTPDQNVPTIAECVRHIDMPTRGELYLVPAGEYNEGYIHRLADLDIRVLYQREKKPVRELLDDVKKYLDPDVILIDARTGFTEIGAIALFDLADLGVVCFTPNEQSFAGLHWVANAASKQRSYRGFPDLRFLLTPMPAVAPSQQQLWVTRTAAWIADNWEMPPSVVVEDLYYQVPYNAGTTMLTDLFHELPPGTLEPYIPLADAISASLPPEEDVAIPELAAQRNIILSQLQFQTQPVEEMALEDIVRFFQPTGDFTRLLEDRIWFIRGAHGTGKTTLFRRIVEGSQDVRGLRRFERRMLRAHMIPGHGPAGFRKTLLTSTDLSNYEPSGEDPDLRWWAFWEGYMLLQLVTAFPELQALPEIYASLGALAVQDKPQSVDIIAWLGEYSRSRSSGRYSPFQMINQWLRDHLQKVWIVYDELDSIFGQNHGRRRQALDGLIGWWLEMGPGLENIVPKIFLREDVWSELDMANTSSAPNRSIVLRWEEEDLWRLVLRQALETSPILADLINDHLNVGLTGLNNIGREQLQNGLYALWGERMESGNKSYTHTWVNNRISDSQNNRFPHSLLQLLAKALDIERETAEQASFDVILRSQALIEALPFVSEQRVIAMRTTYPEFADLLDKLRGERSPIARDRLGEIWQKEGEGLNDLIKRIVAAGILKVHPPLPDSNVPRYAVGALYLAGLGVKRQGQL